MGDEAFQTKKNEPTHISLRCLEQAVCCIMYCNSGPNFPRSPEDVTSDDAECAIWSWMRQYVRHGRTRVLVGPVSDRETLVGHITMKPRWQSGSARMNRKTAVNNSVTKSAALLWRVHARSRAWMAAVTLAAVVSLLSLICKSCHKSL